MTGSAPRYDVAVVGLGAMGAAALYQLARRGVRVVGIDAHAPPHALGSSHGETRITRLAVGEGDAYVPFVKASHRIWRDLEAATGRTLLVASGLAIMDEPAMGAAVHGETDFLAKTARIAAAHGIAHEMLDCRVIAARFPAFKPTSGTRAYVEPQSGYLIPEACIEAQLGEARRLGAHVRTGLCVTELAETGAGVSLATPDGTITADRAIVATGGWTGPLLGRPFDRLLSVQRQTFHWFALDTDFPGRSPIPAFIWLHGAADTGQIYGFPPLPGASALKVATERYGTPGDMDRLDRAVPPDESSALHAAHVASRLRGVAGRPERTAVCAYTVTPDFGFIVDQHPSLARLTVVSACSGHGFKHAAGIGEALAQLLVDGRSDADLAPFALSRFV